MSRLVIVIVVLAIVIFAIKRFVNGPACDSIVRHDDKVALVTGANTGLGKESTVELVQRGMKVYMACRSNSRCTEAARDVMERTGKGADKVITMNLDLSSFKAIREFVVQFKQRERVLHVLLNNAGVMIVPFGRTKDGLETTIGVNHFGHFLLTNLLLDLLKASQPSRVVTVSSKAALMGSGKIHFDDLDLQKQGYGYGVEAYSQSKLANVLFTLQLGKQLQGTGVTTYSLHPGGIDTDLQRNFLDSLGQVGVVLRGVVKVIMWPFFKDISHGVATQVCCAVDPALTDQTGLYYEDVAPYAAPDFMTDDVTAKKLWEVSMDITGLNRKD